MFGQRLRLARKKAGLSMRGLASRVSPEVSVQSISKYESHKMMPSSSVLVGLSKALDVSVDFLMGGHIGTIQEIEFRKSSKTPKRDLAKVEALVTESLESYLTIEDILELKPTNDSLSEFTVEHIGAIEEVDEIAQVLRENWALGHEPVAGMTGLLETKGIRVIEVNLPEKFDGLACKVVCSNGRVEAAVVVSCRTSVERKRFTLAHELAHRVIRGTSNPDIRLEKAMNRFAGAFLVPAQHLRREVGAERKVVTLPELMRLKRQYGVSAAALLIRLGQVGILKQSVIEYAFRSYANPWRQNEPDPIRPNEGFGALEHPQRFENLVWQALGEQLIHPFRAAQLLNRSLESIEGELRGDSL